MTPITNNSDAILVTKFQNGNRFALAELVKRWHKLFCKKAYWLINDKDAAKDIAQDSWTIIMRKIQTLKDPKQFKYWAYGIVCNKAMDWQRKHAKQQKRSLNYDIELLQAQEIDTTDIENLKLVLLKVINNLHENQKLVVRLFYMESYSLKQISVLVNISVGTAKYRLFYAREHIKAVLKNKK